MKKGLKFISLLLVIVLLMGVLSSCALFGRDTAKYRDQVAMTVGDESIKIGRILDYYISNYYQNYSNIAYGYMTLEELFSMTISDLTSKYSKLDSYKKGGNPTFSNSFVGSVENAEYLTQAEINFVVAYIKFSLFTSIDSYLEQYITAEIADLGTLDGEDTSRDFKKYDDWTETTAAGGSTYAEYLFTQSLISEDAEEYFEDYYGLKYKQDIMSMTASDYIASTAYTQARVDKYNERLQKYVDDQEEEVEDDYVYPTISIEQVVEFQQRALNKYEKNIKTNYLIEMDQYLLGQIEDAVISVIGQKFDLNANLLVEQDSEFLNNLQKRFLSNVEKTIADYGAKSDAYKDFIEALSDSSFIYSIPNDYVGKYIFVKNLLVPFDDYQKTLLNNYATIVGSDSPAYKQKLLEVATGISARDFDIKDEEDSNAYIGGIFDLDANGDLVISGTGLSNKFITGVKTGIFGGSTQDFMDLMGRFNTDIGQHATVYDYVVRIGDTPDSFTHPWVPEFVDAANEAYNISASGGNGYSICVSSYGVHIVLYSGDVTAWDSYDVSKVYQSDSFEYSYMVSYYNSVLSTYTKSVYENLEDEYKYGGKVSINKEFEKLVSEYGFTFDFEEFTTKSE